MATYVTHMSTKPSRRLTPKDWLTAGLDVLCSHGPGAVKAEPLARHLGTTKGSFYWHFQDVRDFHEKLLAVWEASVLEELVTVLKSEQTPTGRLRYMAQVIATPAQTSSKDNPEPAIRGWARSCPPASAAVARVDAERLGALHELLSGTGISNPEMARIIYATGIGMKQMGEAIEGENQRSMGSLVDLVLALR